jgi:formate/nitrite transporter FocA (FNT family)
VPGIVDKMPGTVAETVASTVSIGKAMSSWMSGWTALPVTTDNIIDDAVFMGMSYWGAYLGPERRLR